MKTNVVLLFISLFLALFSVALSAECQGTPNLLPFYTEAPVLVDSTPNGKLYKVGNSSQSLHPMHILHLYGTPYQWGYAHGTLLKKEVGIVIESFLKHIEDQLDEYVKAKWIPEPIRRLIERFGINLALDLTYDMTKNYISDYWIEEMQGLADASGVPYVQIRRLHMLPELVKAGCSIFGAWGPATPNGTLIQLRALDWDMTSELQQYPLLIVRHPEAGNGNKHAALGWAGWIAALTGMSANSIGISEKFGDITFGYDSRIGIPFYFLMRDIIQYDNTLEEALTRMKNAKRTCSIYIGVGDGKINSARVSQYSAAELNIWDDQNQWNTTQHPQIDDIVYIGVRSECYSSLLKKYRGQLSAENAIRYVIPVSRTGNLHAALYDFKKMVMYVSNASPDHSAKLLNAFDRTFIRLDMNALFAVEQ